MPHLFYAIDQNVNEYQELRFFECSCIWSLVSPREVVEHKVVAGALFDQTAQKDFYAFKQELEIFFDQLKVSVTWHKAAHDQLPWFDVFQTAIVMLGDKPLGVAGMIKNEWIAKVAPLGTMFMFEFDRKLLIDYKCSPVQVKQLSRYPSVRRDFSIFVSRNIAATTIEKQISQLDDRIENIEIIDFLERDEWPNKRALTVRVILRDDHKTLEKNEIDTVEKSINRELQSLGAEIR
jgi:phenylalanyl-tRNA synthetase beta subunit